MSWQSHYEIWYLLGSLLKQIFSESFSFIFKGTESAATLKILILLIQIHIMSMQWKGIEKVASQSTYQTNSAAFLQKISEFLIVFPADF